MKDALDLCLACKGCKGDCPVNVDMATYKAEFLSHYYEGRLRTRSAYAFGLIDQWARLASPIAGLANLVTQTPGLSAVAKFAAGMSQERQIPPFAPETFKAWFARRERKNVGQKRVILWPDTFNNYFLPNTARAATEVLEAAGFQVMVPQMHLCCGRPLYDYGMLDLAKSYLRKILDTLGEEIDGGVPVVVLEPSCLAVFKDEMHNLFPNDQRVNRLREQAQLLPQFLDRKAKHWSIPELHADCFVQVHCHQKALFKIESEEPVLKRLGLNYDLPNNGCCGLAGSFGFEHDKYDVSEAVEQHELEPYLQKTNPETIILADGFSCREQVKQFTDREGLHLAEVIQLAMHSDGRVGPYPERKIAGERKRAVRKSIIRAAALVAGAVGLGLWLWRREAA